MRSASMRREIRKLLGSRTGRRSGTKHKRGRKHKPRPRAYVNAIEARVEKQHDDDVHTR